MPASPPSLALEKSKKNSPFKRFCKIAGPLVGIPAAILFLAMAVGFLQIYVVPTGGMSPTLRTGDTIFVTKLNSEGENFRRGQAIVFKTDGMNYNGQALKGSFVQRVVALPGDTVTINGGSIHVNGQRIEMEGRISQGPMTTVPHISFPLSVAEDHLFLLGDNYATSIDSRYFGPVESSRVTHLPNFRILPPAGFGKID